MALASVRRWQWIAISILVGLLLGYVRQQGADGLQDHFGESINSQRRFEEMLLATEQGRPAFDNVMVHAQFVSDDTGRTIRAYVVAGTAFDGHYEEENGKLVAHWRPRFFIAKNPYRLKLDLSTLNRPGRPDFSAQFLAIREPTVVDFLSLLSRSRGLSYTHAWWREMGIIHWTIASVVVIGVIWPTLINLLAHGSFRRPKDEGGIDLWKVKTGTSPAPPPTLTGDDQAHLEELNAELEQKLAEEERLPQPPAAHAAALPIQEINAVTPESAQVPDIGNSPPEFGVKRDDFYPTEVHASKGGKRE